MQMRHNCNSDAKTPSRFAVVLSTPPGFADDTQLYVSFKPDYPCDQCEAISVMESCVNDLRKWTIQDKSKLNDGKTEPANNWI
jgi:hypothetical protein